MCMAASLVDSRMYAQPKNSHRIIIEKPSELIE